ncbi:MAG: VWA domain-containing protein [Bacteroidota bacterium]
MLEDIFRFERPEHLYALLALPVLILLFWRMWVLRKRAIQRFATSRMQALIMPQLSRYKHLTKFLLLAGALIFLIVGWANPQMGTREATVEEQVVEVMLALDVSKSMLAQDVVPSRLERSKRLLSNLIDQLEGKQVGFVLFAGNADLQVPLTRDYNALRNQIKTANPKNIYHQGTAISDAIDVAVISFDQETANNKALILITDGENHEEIAVSAAANAKDAGIQVFTIGVGSEEGSFIPDVVRGRTDYVRDRTGNPVRSKMNEALLREIADAGNGEYYNLLGAEDDLVAALQSKVNAIEKGETKKRVFEEYNSYFQLLLGLALLLLMIEFMLSYRRNKYLAQRDLFNI